jgi:uncharacterized membrane protein
MKTKQIILVIVLAVLIVAVFTNPNQLAHKEKVKSTITALYQKKMVENKNTSSNSFASFGNLLGSSLISVMVENGVSSESYFFFSITKMTYDGKEKSIGFGLLGNVFLSSKIEEAFDKK